MLKIPDTCRFPHRCLFSSSRLQKEIIIWSHRFFFFGFCRIVLPEGEAPLTNQSRASTPSSGKVCLFVSFLFNWWRWWINITVCVITVIAHLKCYIWVMRPLRIRDWFELIECFYFETWLTVFPVCRRTDQLFVFIHRCSTRLWKRSREERWNFVMSSDSKGLFCVFVSFYLAVYQERCYGGRGLTGALRCTMST